MVLISLDIPEVENAYETKMLRNYSDVAKAMARAIDSIDCDEPNTVDEATSAFADLESVMDEVGESLKINRDSVESLAGYIGDLNRIIIDLCSYQTGYQHFHVQEKPGMTKWLSAEAKGDHEWWRVTGGKLLIMFTDVTDATMFKLKWL